MISLDRFRAGAACSARLLAIVLAPCLLVVDAAGQIDERFIPPRVRAMSMAVLTDGVVLVGRSDGEIVSIDPKTGATTDRFASHSASVTEIAIDPRGEFVAAASMDGRVAIWPVNTHIGTRYEGYPGRYEDPALVLRPTPEVWKERVQVEWTHDGDHLVTWSFDWLHGESPTTVQVWSREGELMWTGPHARQVSVHPSRNCIAVVSENEVLFGWPGEDLRAIELEGAYDAIDFSPDGSRLAVGGSEFRVWILDGKSGATKTHVKAEGVGLPGMADFIIRLRWSPDSRWLGAVVGTGLWPAIFDARTLATVWPGGLCGGRGGEMFDVVWTPGGRMLTGFFSVFAVDPRTEQSRTQTILDRVEHNGLIELKGSDEVLLLAGGAVRRIDLTTAKESWKRREQGDGAALVDSEPDPPKKRRR